MNASLPTYIIINPASRSGYGLTLWNRLSPYFRKAGISCTVLLSDASHSISALCRKVSSSGNEINLIILGGDGTLNEAVNGIVDFGKVNLGYIPIGSANDFGKAVGIADPRRAVRTMLKNKKPRMRDLGCVTAYAASDGSCGGSDPQTVCRNRYFNISCGIGFDADCCWLSDHTRIKKLLNRLHLGSLIYLVSAIRLIIALHLVRHVVTIDDSETALFGRSMFTVCMNTCYEGGGFAFCPDADPTDGTLSVCNASGIGRLGFFRLFPMAYSGSHIGCRGITSNTGRRITISSEQPQHFHTDGEVPDEKVTRLEISILPQKVRWLL